MEAGYTTPPTEASTTRPSTVPAWPIRTPLAPPDRPLYDRASPTPGAPLDNLTHSLVGAAVAKAGAERATPLATATLVVAANAPDIDMLSFVRGEYFALAFRRGITHGWLAMAVLPFLVTGAMLAWDRWVRRRRDPSARPADPRALLGLSAVGLLTHPCLDWLNIYGMRWLMPFDGTWTYGDAVFIIDPWLWLALGGAVFLASAPGRRGLWGWGLLAGLTTALLVWGVGGWPAAVWGLGLATIVARRLRPGWASGQRAGHGMEQRTVRVVCVAALAYVAAMAIAGRAARAEVAAAARSEGLEVEAVLVAPVRGVPFESEVEVLTADAYVPGSHHWLRSPRVRLRPADAIPVLDAPDTDPATTERVVEVARTRAPAANYLVWVRFPYVRVTPDAGGWQVRFGDARYDSQPEAAGLAGVTVHVSGDEIR